jgi:hypothetical protein
MHLSRFGGSLTKNSVAVQIGPLHTQPLANISDGHNSNPKDESRILTRRFPQPVPPLRPSTSSMCCVYRCDHHHRHGLCRAPGGGGSQISRKLAHEGGKVIRPTHRPPFPPRYSFLLEADSTPWPECGRKDYVSEKF